MAFSDGSVIDGPFGAGGCAVSIIPKEESASTITKAAPVGTNVDNVESELHGVILALKSTLDYITEREESQGTHDLFVLTDCNSVVDIVTNRSDTRYRHDEFCTIDDTCGSLKAAGVNVHIGWIPAHVGIPNNEDADKHAKAMAARVAKGLVEVDNKIAIPAAIKIAKRISTALWQTRWNRALHGDVTRQLIPKVTTKTIFPDTRCVGISYVRLLLDDTNLKADRWRDGFTESPYCECDTEIETGYHFLMDCPLHDAKRARMHRTILRQWMHTNISGNLSLTMDVLLGSCDGRQFPKELLEVIKKSLFKYIKQIEKFDM